MTPTPITPIFDDVLVVARLTQLDLNPDSLLGSKTKAEEVIALVIPSCDSRFFDAHSSDRVSRFSLIGPLR